MDSVAQGLEVTEAANPRHTLDDWGEAMAREVKTTVEYAAIASFLHSLYRGVGGLIVRRLRDLGHEVPQSDRWHHDVLAYAERFGVIGSEEREELQGVLSFRHFFLHGYPLVLDPDRLLPLAPRAQAIVEAVLRRLDLWVPTAPGSQPELDRDTANSA